MMDKAYILENGILEQYVLGELTKSEQQDVENALVDFPELKEVLKTIEIDFENIAFENELEVPGHVKRTLLDQIGENTEKILLGEQKPSRNFNYAIAASLAGLLLVTSMYVFYKWQSTEQQLQIVEETNASMIDTIAVLNASIADTNKLYRNVADPETEKYVLKGNALMPEATVVSYVNNTKKSIVINTQQLPKLDDGHDYQMWADVKGVMVDMGIINKTKDMMTMTYIDNAESLNITIEPAGGSDHPNVSQLVTNIYLR